jgi:hypothetical protein
LIAFAGVLAANVRPARNIYELMKRTPGGASIACDIPALNQASLRLIRDQLKWEVVFETVRMYTRGIPKGMRMDCIYSVLLEHG